MYDLYSKFDIEQHKKHYVNYLEVILFPDGHIEYAVPSHQEKLISICCEQLKIPRNTLYNICPSEYYGNVIVWMCNLSGCAALWSENIAKSDTISLTATQHNTLQQLKDNGIYDGPT